LNFTLGPAFGIRGLALAYSLAGCVNVALLLYYLRRKVEAPLEGRRLLQTALKSLLAALVMGLLLTLAAAHILLPVTWPRLVREGLELALLITLGVLSYAGLAWLLRMEELAMFLSLLGRRLRRSQAAMG
jgi:putative peptidoglycan lipid II flippase